MRSKVFEMIDKEANRQYNAIELIASENFVSDEIREAVGSILTNKYAEGYPDLLRSGKRGRYYGGCAYVDSIEEYCCQKWKEAFNTNYHVNVQPHSGTNANFAAYASVLNPGDIILSMDLNNGGHLSHGSPVSLTSKMYRFVHYGVDDNGYIDYDDIEFKIRKVKPHLILAGASAYPREIDFKRIYEIIQKVKNDIPEYKPYFMADIAHIAGLVAVGAHQSPFGYADIITTTTHKTLRGPRGALIFCKPDLAKKVDATVFPGVQGGPLMHVIAGKVICAEEVCTTEYKDYIYQVIRNAKAMANHFVEMGYDVVSGGTDNHMLLLDFSKTHPDLSGLEVQEALDQVNVTLNRNTVPNEMRSPQITSGVRIGTPAMTTKGWIEKDFIWCADMIDIEIKKILDKKGNG